MCYSVKSYLMTWIVVFQHFFGIEYNSIFSNMTYTSKLYSSHSQLPMFIERFVLSISTIYSLTYTITRKKNIESRWAQNMLHAHAVYGMHFQSTEQHNNTIFELKTEEKIQNENPWQLDSSLDVKGYHWLLFRVE